MVNSAGYINKIYSSSRYNCRIGKNAATKYSELRKLLVNIKKKENRYFDKFEGTVSL